ncbi:MAG: ethanolamine ammonia-lyase subunit EutC [Pedobacter sp.]|nr:MAG: ethanolamine ammonia-lyase subunit EutC [Pedobacter sp.]
MGELDGKKPIIESSLDFLKELTQARVGLGRAGTSLPTTAVLNFKLAHAEARDAVYTSLPIQELIASLAPLKLHVFALNSEAMNRSQYLQRPDLGRVLSVESISKIENDLKGNDVVFCIADGLSSTAIEKNVFKVLEFLIPQLQKANFSLGKIYIITQGRVAVADHIGDILKAGLSLIFIGERPGLSAADSMGIYLTYQPKLGLTDDSRNCISNIRDGGLSAQLAADKAFYLINEAFRRKVSGIELKDDQNDRYIS